MIVSLGRRMSINIVYDNDVRALFAVYGHTRLKTSQEHLVPLEI